ncbi:MAG: hypothetical protein B0D92_08795 [Spirochaeta sp. LUC14_002_19_P3]|nr:MAG: hypothetical protein B0D92_08795 [Spirochaeta sp. LUC14_002_19_P3]
MGNIADELKKISVFSELSDEDLDAIAKLCRVMKFSKGYVIAKEGFDANELFALLEGSVEIWVDYNTGNADLIATTKAPNIVGEMSIVDELPRSATIVAQTDIKGYSIEANNLRQLLKLRGAITMALVKNISNIVRLSNDSFINELRSRNLELIEANNNLKIAHKQLLRQERLSNLGKFSSIIMHDLRNPLTVIKAYADMLELNLEKEINLNELKKCCSLVRRETIRLTNLTNEWLDYSRGEFHLAYAPMKTADLFESLKTSMAAILKTKEINILWNNQFSGVILLDTERILRMLINLVDNAVHACSKLGEIIISAQQEEGFLLLTVKDNGIGMDNETINHVFDPLYTHDSHGGTGLGMHIVKTIVEAHQGTVDIQSSTNEGTEVIISLPLQL